MLDSSHYAMLEVKEKVLRYMACQKYLGKNYGAVMLLLDLPEQARHPLQFRLQRRWEDLV